MSRTVANVCLIRINSSTHEKAKRRKECRFFSLVVVSWLCSNRTELLRNPSCSLGVYYRAPMLAGPANGIWLWENKSNGQTIEPHCSPCFRLSDREWERECTRELVSAVHYQPLPSSLAHLVASGSPQSFKQIHLMLHDARVNIKLDG